MEIDNQPTTPAQLLANFIHKSNFDQNSIKPWEWQALSPYVALQSKKILACAQDSEQQQSKE